jgi:hypothetical protein
MRPLPLLLALLLAAAPAAARNPDSGRDRGGGEPAMGGHAHGIAFAATEKQRIREYFAVPEHRQALGDTGKALPPGLQKKLARGRLPPGIEKRYLPAELEAALPPHPGVERVVLGDDVLLVETESGFVLDILHGALGAR